MWGENIQIPNTQLQKENLKRYEVIYISEKRFIMFEFFSSVLGYVRRITKSSPIIKYASVHEG